MERLRHVRVDTPVGELLVLADATGLTLIAFPGRGGPAPEDGWAPANTMLREAARQLQEYFDGKLCRFDLPLHPQGTDFQQATWRALREIPYGVTKSYAEIARSIGRPTATRAVGAANGRNPLSIVVPCHRVVGSNGDLTGFGGGLERKSWLLRHEGAMPPRPGRLLPFGS